MDIVEAAARAPALAISWGTIAQYVGKGKLERNDSHTHKWMVFLRGAHNQDLSYAISKVTFQLHRDYENYRRGATRARAGRPTRARCSPAHPTPTPSHPPTPHSQRSLRRPTRCARRAGAALTFALTFRCATLRCQ